MDEQARKHSIWRRGQVLAEMMFLYMNPACIARDIFDDDDGYDYFVGFYDTQFNLNLYLVKVEATENPINGNHSIRKKLFENLVFVNIPCLLLVVDVKQDQLFYSWLTDGETNGTLHDAKTRDVPVVHLDEGEKAKLRAQMVSGVV